MGHRTHTYVYEDTEITNTEDALVCIYHQWGLPSEYGRRLGEFLRNIELVNGYGSDANIGTQANGMGCLAAQLIGSEKSKLGLGGCYITAVQEEVDTLFIEYIYEIWPNKVKISKTSWSAMAKVNWPKDKVIYQGDWKDIPLNFDDE